MRADGCAEFIFQQQIEQQFRVAAIGFLPRAGAAANLDGIADQT